MLQLTINMSETTKQFYELRRIKTLTQQLLLDRMLMYYNCGVILSNLTELSKQH